MRSLILAAALLAATPALAALPAPPKPPAVHPAVNSSAKPPAKPSISAQLAQAQKQLSFAEAAIRVLGQHLTACNNAEIGAEVRLSVRRPPTP